MSVPWFGVLGRLGSCCSVGSHCALGVLLNCPVRSPLHLGSSRPSPREKRASCWRFGLRVRLAGRDSSRLQLGSASMKRVEQQRRHEALCWKRLVCSPRSAKAILEPMTGRARSTSFVGREEEPGRLQQGLRSAAAGEPGTLLIAGEAGVGKTRLVREFASQVANQAEVLLGSCIPLSRGLPYGPMVDALRPLARDLDRAELDELLGPTPAAAPPRGARAHDLTRRRSAVLDPLGEAGQGGRAAQPSRVPGGRCGCAGTGCRGRSGA
jgi:AAA ATPase domain